MTISIPSACATAIGSMPQTDPLEACTLVLEHLPELPAWPQLPQRSPLEDMITQFSEGFPGLAYPNGHVVFQKGSGFEQAMERLNTAYAQNLYESYDIGPHHAAGLHSFLLMGSRGPMAKGQLTGPVTFGLAVQDQRQRPIIYDDALAHAAARHLQLKAAWQEQVLRTAYPQTVMFVDEPHLGAFGTTMLPLSRERIADLLEEVLAGIHGIKGIHCCSNTDLALPLHTSIDILSVDAYSFTRTILDHAGDLKGFLSRGGFVAWGVVPPEVELLGIESEYTLFERWEELLRELRSKGIPLATLTEQCMITPACGLGMLPSWAARKALRLTGRVSEQARRRYGIARREQTP